MSETNFPSRVPHVQSGEPVSASTASRPDRALEARTNYLREALLAIEEGRLLVWKDQRVDPAVAVGQPVYWHAANQRFELALAAVEIDAESGTLVPKASTDCVGLVLSKHGGGSLAHIALGGVACVPSMAAAIPAGAEPGRYYLSSAVDGTLTRQRPPVTVPVCIVLGPQTACDENVWVYILPQMRDFLEDHIHYRFELVAQPAGTHVPPEAGEPHVITEADAALPGWLPADDPSFHGRAPAGAKFGYNLSQHQSLSRVWPPIPLEAATMFWDRGEELRGATEVPAIGTLRLVTFDRYGIWWMSDCYGDVPWPTDYVSGDAPGVLSSESLDSVSSVGADCPRAERMRVIVSFLHMLFTTARTMVTSLQPGANEPLEFVNCDGVVANTGDLWARLRLQALLAPNEYYGGQVFKELVGPGLTFGLGWVTEGLVAASTQVLLTGSHQRLLNPALPGSPTNPVVHQGVVRVDVDIDPAERELSPQIVRLGDALERMYLDVPYIALPEGRDSGIRLRFNVPAIGLPTTPVVKIRVMLFGRANGSLPPLVMTYRRLARPGVTPTTLTGADTTVAFPVENLAVLADQAHEVESDPFTVAAGDTLLVSIERVAGSGYNSAEVGLIRTAGIILPGG
jgi:hypothetical protein